MVVKLILKYLRGATNQGILCFGGSNIALQGYVDALYRDNKRSTIGYVFTVGGTIVNWF